MTDPVTLKPETRDLIQELVQDHWAENGKPLLLARLGQLMSARGLVPYAELGGRKMRDVLESELADDLIVAQSPSDPTIAAVVPRGAGKTGTRALKHTNVSPSKAPQAPRFQRAFWSAFTWPLDPGEVREIKFDPLGFVDVSLANAAPGACTVDPSDVVTKKPEQSPREHQERVLESIRAWLKRNNLVEASFLVSAETQREKSKKGGESLLDRVISSLSDDQLRRCSLPLDVVSKLAKS